jgi:hypothetical protein
VCILIKTILKMEFTDCCLRLRHPSNSLVVGATGTGKSTLLAKLLASDSLTVKYDKILYCVGIFDPSYLKLSETIPNLELYYGYPEEVLKNLESKFDPQQKSCIVFDDLGQEAVENPLTTRLFCQQSSHFSISTYLVLHNLYMPSKHFTTISRQATYILLTASLRDRSTISTLGRQVMPSKPKFLLSCYEKAMETPYNNLLIDLHTTTPEVLRVRENIAGDGLPIVYLPA